jgi:hypothetical protein
LSVRYSVISGLKSLPAGNALTMRPRYSTACAAVTTGGFRFGITIARAN